MSEHGIFYWNELMTNDVEGAKDFYAATLGWTYSEFPGAEFTYWICMAGDKPVGGIMPLEGFAPEGVGPHWFSYISVDDVDARVTAARESGGTVQREPFDVPEVGRIAVLKDATGAAIGLMTPAGN